MVRALRLTLRWRGGARCVDCRVCDRFSSRPAPWPRSVSITRIGSRGTVKRSGGAPKSAPPMNRTWLRGRANVHKRYLLHVAGYNLGLIMRLLTGHGTPARGRRRPEYGSRHRLADGRSAHPRPHRAGGGRRRRRGPDRSRRRLRLRGDFIKGLLRQARFRACDAAGHVLADTEGADEAAPGHPIAIEFPFDWFALHATDPAVCAVGPRFPEDGGVFAGATPWTPPRSRSWTPSRRATSVGSFVIVTTRYAANDRSRPAGAISCVTASGARSADWSRRPAASTPSP